MLRRRSLAKPKAPKGFEEHCEKLIQYLNSPIIRCMVVYAPVPYAALGVGMSAVAGPIAALACWAGITGLGGLVSKRRTDRPARVDWDAAAAYEAIIVDQMTPETAKVVRAALDELAQETGHRAHAYRAGCMCGKSACVCVMRWSAAVIPPKPALGSRTVLIVGDRLLQGDPKVLEFLLAHERTHATRSRRWATRLHHIARTAAALIAGILAPGATSLVATAALLGVCALWSWIIEIACDIPAARRHGAAADTFWALSRVVRARIARAWHWWQVPFGLAARAVPPHPPIWLRAWICRRVHAQTLR